MGGSHRNIPTSLVEGGGECHRQRFHRKPHVDYKVLDIMAVYNPAIPPSTGGFLGLDLG